MMHKPSEHTFTGKDGLRIFYRAWKPRGQVRAVVVICHGLNSHGGQYTWVADQFAKSGIAVCAVDLRGRGRSEGERLYVTSVDDYADDVRRLVTIAKQGDPDVPVFLLGHSVGGVVSCIYTLDNQVELAGLICESFAFKVPAPDFALGAIKLLSHVAPRLPTIKLKNKDFTRDPVALQILNTDPLIADEVQPAMTVAALVRADERLKKDFPRMTLPVLIMHGTADKATLARGSQFFFETVGSIDRTLKLYEGNVHDLFNDLDKETVMLDTQAWIDRQIVAWTRKSSH
jgi:acylglycerol lipase